MFGKKNKNQDNATRVPQIDPTLDAIMSEEEQQAPAPAPEYAEGEYAEGAYTEGEYLPEGEQPAAEVAEDPGFEITAEEEDIPAEAPEVQQEELPEPVPEANELQVAEQPKIDHSAIIYSALDDIDTDMLTDTEEGEVASRKAEKVKTENFVKNPVEPAKLNLTPSEDKKNKGKPSAKSLLLVITCLAVVIIVVGFLVFIDAGFKDKFQSPLTINNIAVPSDEFSFMYHYVLIENGVDVFAGDTKKMMESPADDPNFKTNRDYFLDLTAQEMQRMQILYDDAVKNGFKVEEKHYTMANAYVEWLGEKAKELDVPLDTYIQGVFGSQVSEQCVRDTLAKKYFTEDYGSDAKLVELQASPDQANAAYEANKNTYDLVSYKLLRITYEQADQAFVDTATRHANKIIEAMGHDQSKFETAASEYFSGDAKEELMKPDSRLVKDARYTDFDHNEFRDWLFEDGRQSGDTTIFQDEKGFPILLCFVSRQPQSTPLRNVRIIEITANEEFTLGDAQVLAQEVYDYIDDSVSLQSVESRFTDEVLAGIIKVSTSSDTYPGKFVDPLDSWIFFETRKAGDKDILETENGFDVLYFIEESEMPEWYDRVNSFIRMNNYEAFMNEQLTEYTYEFNQSGLDQIFDVP